MYFPKDIAFGISYRQFVAYKLSFPYLELYNFEKQFDYFSFTKLMKVPTTTLILKSCLTSLFITKLVKQLLSMTV